MEILFIVVFIVVIAIKVFSKNDTKRKYNNNFKNKSDYEFVFNRKNDKNHFSNRKYNSNYFNNRKHNINQGLEKDIIEINKNQKTRYKQYTEEEKKSYGQRMKELREKGKEYEKYVAGHFKTDGYEIFLNGIKNGVRDRGTLYK